MTVSTSLLDALEQRRALSETRARRARIATATRRHAIAVAAHVAGRSHPGCTGDAGPMTCTQGTAYHLAATVAANT